MDALLRFAHASESRTNLLLPAWATSSFTTVAGQAGWRGVKPSLDALIDIAAAGCVIKVGAGQMAGENRPPHRSYRAGRPDRRAVSAGLFLRAKAQPAAFRRQGNPDAYERITVF